MITQRTQQIVYETIPFFTKMSFKRNEMNIQNFIYKFSFLIYTYNDVEQRTKF